MKKLTNFLKNIHRKQKPYPSGIIKAVLLLWINCFIVGGVSLTAQQLLEITPDNGPWTEIIGQGSDSNGDVYFVAYSNSSDRKLYRYDGTTMTEITPSGGPWALISSAGTDDKGNIYFRIYSDSDDEKLYRYDGTTMTEITPSGSSWEVISRIGTDGNDNIYFRIYSNTNNERIYRYDGTTMTDITPNGGTWRTAGGRGTDGNGNIYFLTFSNASDQRLYHYDGTTMTEITPSGGTWGFIDDLGTDDSGNIYFRIFSNGNDEKIYRYDGTTMTEVTPSGDTWSHIEGLGMDSNGNIYFRIYSDGNDEKLYRYNSTTMTEITPSGDTWSDITTEGTDDNGNIYFRIYSDGNDEKLYHYDGTTMTDITPSGASWSFITNLGTDGSNNIYFQFIPTSGDQILYRYDGTTMTDITPSGGSWSSIEGEGTDGNGNIYINVYTDINDQILFYYDGTTMTEITPNGGSWKNIFGLGMDGSGDAYIRFNSVNSESRLFKTQDCDADDMPPTAICQDVTIDLDANGMATLTLAQVNNGSMDNCTAEGDLTFNLSQTDFDCDDLSPPTIAVTLTVTDELNNSATCISNVTVKDDPTFTCPSDQDVYLNENCEIVIPDLLTGITDEADNCVTPTLSQNPTAGTTVSSTDDTHDVVITADDGNGNTTTCTVTLTKVDIPPVPDDQTGWDVAARLLSGDPNSGDLLGFSVSISGNQAIVGAHLDDEAANNAGGAYIFEKIGDNWVQIQKLLASDPNVGDNFGRAVAISGNQAIVGAHQDDEAANNGGAAYIFEKVNGTWTEIQKLVTLDPNENDNFGWSVGISGDQAIIAAYRDDEGADNAGATYIFEKVNGTWTEIKKLLASDPNENDNFGFSVSISGDQAVVGAYQDDEGGSNAGAAYTFEKVNGIWTEIQKLTASDGSGNDNFGISVAIEGDQVLIGAYRDDPDLNEAGSAYIFEKVNGTWTEIQKLVASAPTAEARFGRSVAISGDLAIVGAYQDDDEADNSGASYVFEKINGSWVETQKLKPIDPDAEDLFGFSVAISDNQLLIGAYQDDKASANGGTAYLLTLNSDLPTLTAECSITITPPTATDNCDGTITGTTTVPLSYHTPGTYEIPWSYTDAAGNTSNQLQTVIVGTISASAEGAEWAIAEKVLGGDGHLNARFGWSVAISGNQAIVGAPRDDPAGSDSGTAFIFEKVNGTWTPIQQLIASDATASDQFGISVAISSDQVIVGAYLEDDQANNQGAAYIFEKVNGTWTEIQKLLASDPNNDDNFGYSVAISGDQVIVGAYQDDAGASNAGAAYIFEKVNGTWTEIQKLLASDPNNDDRFGWSVSISGDQTIIGAYLDDERNLNAGAAYIFEKTNGTWTQTQKLTASDGNTNDNLGYSVAISSDHAILSAPGDDEGANNAGAAYVFEKVNGTWTQAQKLTAADPFSNDDANFGRSVAISGNQTIVGTYRDDEGANNAGAVYIFEKQNDTWVKIQRLIATDPASGDNFGQSVAISGNEAIVGAPFKYEGITNAGAAYFLGPPITTPDINIKGNGETIANGDDTPSAVDHTNFDVVPTGGSLTRTFVIENLGTGTLELTGTPIVDISTNDGFSISTQPTATSIASGAEALSFMVTFAPSSQATVTATITILNDDCDEGLFTFDVSGAGGCNLVIDAVNTIDEDCPGDGGSLSIHATCLSCPNGNTDLEYSADGMTYQASNSFDLMPNTYTVYVRDATDPSCEATALATINASSSDEPPTANCKNISRSLDVSGMVSITAADVDNGSTDACGTVGLGIDETDFTCADIGDNFVTLTVTDEGNNTATCLAVLTIIDDTAPVAACQNVTLQLDENGAATLTTAQVDNNSTDNCTTLNMTLDQTLFDCEDVGNSPEVTLTVTDGSGNTHSCMATITVGDNIAPAAICQDVTVSLGADGMATLSPAEVNNGSSDNCTDAGNLTFSLGQTNFSCDDLPAWENVGMAGFSAGFSGFADYQSLAFDNGVPHIAFRDRGNGNKATVMKYDGTNWVNVGTLGFSDGEANFINLVFDNGEPYVAFQDFANGNETTVMKFDGTDWVNVGMPHFSATRADHQSLAFHNGVPYVAFKDDTNDKTTVMKLDGMNWVNVGMAGFSEGEADDQSLAFHNGEPYVAFRDNANGDKTTVMKFDGMNWVIVGMAGFSDGRADFQSLASYNGEPYVAFQDEANGDKTTVMKYDGMNWVNVGPAGFSTVAASYQDLVFQNGQPYVAFRDDDNNSGVTVMRYNGTNWENVGMAGFSEGDAHHISLAFDNGAAYVAFRDAANGNRSTVMKFSSENSTTTLTVTDQAGNSTSCITNVTVEDILAPTFTCPSAQDVELNGDCEMVIPDLLTDISDEADNCGTATLSQAPIASTTVSSTEDMTHNVVITAEDDNGNTTTCTVTLTAKDLTAPTALCQDVTVSLGTDGTANLTTAEVNNGSSDNCTAAGDLTFSLSQSSFDCDDLPALTPIPVTLTVTDEANNSTNCVTNVTLQDNIAPTFTCPPAQLVGLNGNCELVVPDLLADITDEADNCGVPTLSQNPMATTAMVSTAGATQDVVITADDGNGNTTSCTVTLTVEAPEINVQHNGTDIESGDDTPQAADGTDFGIVLMGQMPTQEFTIQNTGNQALNLTGSPRVSIIGSTDFSISIQPSSTTIGADGNLIFELQFAPTSSGTQTATISIANDDCDENPYTFDVQGTGSCTIIINNVTVTHEECPNEANGTITVSASCTGCIGDLEYSINGTDFQAGNEFTGLEDGTYTVTVRDEGNTACLATAADNVINPGEDDTDPVAVCQDVTVYLDANGMATLNPAAVNDGSSDNCTVAGDLSFSLSQTAFDCDAFLEETIWQNVGAAGFSAGIARDLSLAFYNEEPYVAFGSGGANVMKYNGSTWENVGAAGFSAGGVQYLSLAFHNGEPYVAFRDDGNGEKATVMKFDGDNWVNVGNAGFSDGSTAYQSLAFHNGIPYVAFRDTENGRGTTVMKLNGNIWEVVGNAGFSGGRADYQSLAFYNGEPYVAFLDAPNEQKATVMKYSGNIWEVVGNVGFSDARATYLSLAFQNGEPYVAFQDNANASKTTVMKYNGTNWENVGQAGFSAGSAKFQSLAFYNGEPYVAFEDVTNGSKTTVMKYNNMSMSWEDVGEIGFSAGGAESQSLAFRNGKPYVAFQDVANANKATVMKFAPTPIPVTLTVTDEAGNSANCITNVTVEDILGPTFTCPSAQDVELNDDCEMVIPDLLTDILDEADNCGTATLSQDPIALSTISSTEDMTHDVVITAEDDNGNTTTCTVTLTAKDLTAPTALCQDVTVSLGTDGMASLTTAEVNNGSMDNCTAAEDLTFSLSQTVFDCDDLPALTPIPVTLTVTDEANNSANCVTNVTLQDNIAPTFTCPSAQIVGLNGNCELVVPDLLADITDEADNCGAPTLSQDPMATTTMASTAGATQDVVITADDGNGNTTSCTVTLTVEAPEINVQHNGTDIESGDDTPQAADGTDFGIVLIGQMPTQEFTIQNTGNQALNLTGSPRVSIIGSTDFSISIQPSSTTIGADGNLIFELQFAPTSSGTQTATISIANDDCDENPYTFDVQGTGSCTVTINNITVTHEECPNEANGTITVSASCTGCIGDLEYSINGTDFQAENEFTGLEDGTYTVTVRDEGNTACLATVADNVINPGEDDTAPVAVCQDVTVSLDANGMATLNPAEANDGSSDNCTDAGDLTFSLNQTAFDCEDVLVEIPWENVGTAGFSTGTSKYQSLVFHNGEPYVAFQDFGNNAKATVMKYDGNNWVNVGMAGFSLGTAEYQSLAFHNGEPYVAFSDLANSRKTTVMKYDGNNWVDVGMAGFSLGRADYQSLVFHNGEPHVAYKDFTNGQKATVMKYDGNSWVNVGTAGFSITRADYQSLVFHNGEPHVAFQDWGNNAETTVMKYDGNNWVNVGTAGFSTGAADYQSLAFYNDEPYVAFQDEANGDKTTVMKYDGNNWVNVGTAGFSAGIAKYQSLVFHNGEPYVAFQDAANDDETTVMKYDGNNWVNVGAAGFSAGAAEYQSLAFHNGELYVAFRDNANNDETTVMKFASSPLLVTLTVMDEAGNSASCMANVTVEDKLAPVAQCQDVVVNLDASGNGSTTAAAVNDGSSDNCTDAGSLTLALNQNDFTCEDAGMNTVTLSVSDQSGNSHNCTATVTVQESVAPVAQCQDVTVQLNALGEGSTTVAAVNNGSTDNCSIASMTLNQSTFGCADINTPPMITLTVTDGSGNSHTCTSEVTVEDNVAPVAECKNITIPLDSDGEASITGADIDNSSADACGIASLTPDITSFGCSDLGANNVILTVEDNNGNTDNCSATVFVEDNVDPIANCQDVTVQLDNNGEASLTTGQVNNSSTDNCGITSMMLSQTAFDCEDVASTTEVTLTVTDQSGNSHTCTATITVQDNVNPVAQCQNLTVQLNASGNGSITPAQVNNGSTDNCGIANLTLDDNTFDCSDIATSPMVTLTVTDVNGNSHTCTATVTVEDNVAPVAQCQDVVVNLNASGDGSTTAAAVNDASSDNCTDAGSLGFTLSQTDFTCADVGMNTVTLSVTDEYSNVNTCEATVTVQESVAPVAQCQNVTVQLNALGEGSTTAAAVNNGSTDNCSIASMTLNQNTFDCDDIDTPPMITLTVTDGSGNSHICTSEVTVEDNVAPVAECKNITIPLDASGAASIAGSDIDNNSADACGIASLTPDMTSFGCSDLGANNVILTVEDNNGNTDNCSATVFIEDNVDPMANCQDVTVQLDNNGEASLTTGQVNNSSTDNCGITSMMLSQTAFDCEDVASTTDVTLTVTDQSGNSHICTATITVQDNVNPVAQCQNLTVQLNAGGNGSITPTQVNNGSSDNCGIANLALDDDSFDCSDIANPSTVTLTVTDDNGNSHTCTATITVEDNVAPVAQCQDVVVNLNADGDGSTTATAVNDGSSDNCTNAGILTLALSQTDFTCNEVGQNTVTLSVTDEYSNVNTCEATVTVQESVAPVAQCQDVTVQLNALGEGSTTAAAVNNGSTDNCSIASMTLNQNTFDCDDIDTPPMITLTVTDGSGNSHTCTSEVTVEDNVAPVAECKNITIPLDASGAVSIAGSDIDNNSADACGIASLTPDMTSFGCSDLGANNVILTVEDNNGNSDDCSAIVFVEDDIDPMANCQDVTIQLNNSGEASLTTGQVNNNSTDNCSIVNMALSRTTFDCDDVATPPSVTFTVTDGSGNSHTCIAIITVQDNVNPVAQCQNLTVQLDASGNGSITPAQVNNGSTDNCGIANLTLDDNTFDCSDIATSPMVTLTATDVNGNSHTCTATITVEDNVAPVAQCQDVVVNLNASGNGSTTAAAVNDGSSDNCTNAGILTLALSQTNFTCDEVGQNAVTLSVTDEYGNVNTCETTVTVQESIAPVAQCQNVTVQLNALGEGSTTAVAVNNGSTDNCSIASMTLNQNTFDCDDIDTPPTITLTVTDGSGNSHTCTSTVNVEDNVAPIAECKNITIQLNGSGTTSITGADINNNSSDACGIASLTANETDFNCNDLGSNNVLLTVLDNNGNSDNCSAIVFVEDNVSPVANCQDITVQLNIAGEASITSNQINNNSTDNCGVTSLSLDRTLITCDDLFETTVQLTATDASGNSNTCTATVTLQDFIAPQANCRNVVIELDENSQAAVTAEEVNNNSTDNCSIQNLEVSPATFDCNDIGINVVTLTVTDEAGNSNNCTPLVIVEDNLAPDAQCQAVTITVNSNGIATLNANQVDNGSSDNCQVSGLSLSQEFFGCEDVGQNNVVTLTVTDEEGNFAECTATITVEDNGSPTITCPSDFSVATQPNECHAIVNGIAPGVGNADNCGSMVTYVLSGATTDSGNNDASGSTMQIGTTTVTYTNTDASGNNNSCSFNVTVMDNQQPIVTCPPTQSFEVDLSCGFVVPNYTSLVSAVDNCTSAANMSYVQTPDMGTMMDGPGVFTISVTSIDEAQNAVTCHFDLEVCIPTELYTQDQDEIDWLNNDDVQRFFDSHFDCQTVQLIDFQLNSPQHPDAMVDIQMTLRHPDNGDLPIDCYTSVFIGEAPPLAVNWLDFTAELNKEQEGVLTWVVAREIDNDFFEIERSQNGRDFETIGEVVSRGFSEDMQTYQFIDENLYPALNYYRIKQVDKRGTYSYSDIRLLMLDEPAFSLYPNPTTDEVNLVFGLEEGEKVQIEVFSVSGQLLYAEQLAVGFGPVRLSFNDLNIRTSGMYLLRAKTDKVSFQPVSVVKME